MTEIKKLNFEQYSNALLILQKDIEETKLDETKILKAGSIVKIVEILTASNLIFVEDVNEKIWEIKISEKDMTNLGISDINSDSCISTDQFVVLKEENIDYLKSSQNKRRYKLCYFYPLTIIIAFVLFVLNGFVMIFMACVNADISPFMYSLLGLVGFLCIINVIWKKTNSSYSWAFPYYDNNEVAQELDFFTNSYKQ